MTDYSKWDALAREEDAEEAREKAARREANKARYMREQEERRQKYLQEQEAKKKVRCG